MGGYQNNFLFGGSIWREIKKKITLTKENLGSSICVLGNERIQPYYTKSRERQELLEAQIALPKGKYFLLLLNIVYIATLELFFSSVAIYLNS